MGCAVLHGYSIIHLNSVFKMEIYTKDTLKHCLNYTLVKCILMCYLIIYREVLAMAKNSEARIKANNKYNDKTYDRINIAVPKGNKARLQEIANRYGLSVNGYLNRLIDEAMVREEASLVEGDSTGGVVSVFEDG